MMTRGGLSLRLQELVCLIFVLVQVYAEDFGKLRGWTEKERGGQVDCPFISSHLDYLVQETEKLRGCEMGSQDSPFVE